MKRPTLRLHVTAVAAGVFLAVGSWSQSLIFYTTGLMLFLEFYLEDNILKQLNEIEKRLVSEIKGDFSFSDTKTQ